MTDKIRSAKSIPKMSLDQLKTLVATFDEKRISELEQIIKEVKDKREIPQIENDKKNEIKNKIKNAIYEIYKEYKDVLAADVSYKYKENKLEYGRGYYIYRFEENIVIEISFESKKGVSISCELIDQRGMGDEDTDISLCINDHDIEVTRRDSCFDYAMREKDLKEALCISEDIKKNIYFPDSMTNEKICESVIDVINTSIANNNFCEHNIGLKK